MRPLPLLVSVLLLIGALLPAPVAAAEPASPTVTVLSLKGAITPVLAGYLARGVDDAERHGAIAVLLEIDTPGGLDSAMREMIQRIESARVPVIAYVYPPGGRAASAGAYLTMASHVAAMAPRTSIGAATPVGSSGQDIEATMRQKVTNDAAAYLRGIAASHGRNADWAEKAVRQAVSATAEEALALHVVELVAPDPMTLLDRLDGRSVRVGAATVTLHTRHARLQPLGLQPMEGFLQQIANPSIAMLLLNLGMLGMFFELSNPGLIVPGVIGGICLLLAVFALGMIPINAAGVALIAFAFLLFIAELFVPAYGALAVGGVISLVLGASMLVAPGMPGFEVSQSLVATMALTFGVLIAGLAFLAVRAQRRRITTGSEGLIGMVGEVRSELAPSGQVFVDGALWRAVTPHPPLTRGTAVRVEAVHGLTLTVVPQPVQEKAPQ